MSASKDKEKARSKPGLGMRGELQGDILSFGIGSSVPRFFVKKIGHDLQGAIASALSGLVVVAIATAVSGCFLGALLFIGINGRV